MGTVIDGIELRDENDMVVRAHNERLAGFEPKTRELWTAICARDGAEMIDVGAYTGFYSMLAMSMGCRVHAFEPNAHSFRRMLENVRENCLPAHLLSPHRLCAGASNGKVLIRGGAQMSSAFSKFGDGLCEQEVFTAPIDNFAFGAVGAIKIDAEGMEVEVLKGALEVLAASKPDILVECLKGTDEVDSILLPMGYTRVPLDPTMWHYSAGDE